MGSRHRRALRPAALTILSPSAFLPALATPPAFAVPPAFAILLLVGLTACGDAEPGGIYSPWEAEHASLGDTTVVRTVSGSVWGDTMVLVPELEVGELDGAEPYLFGNVRGIEVDASGRLFVSDAQAAEIRVFSDEGEYLYTIGRRGEGPGEFVEPDVVRLRSDGRLVVRDQRNARFSIFAPEGEYLSSWALRSGFFTGTPFYMNHGGEVFHPTIRNLGSTPGRWQSVVVHFDLQGAVVDTLETPTMGYEPPALEVSTETMMSRNFLPFAPNERWAVADDGAFLFGLSQEYRFEKRRANGSVLRIERQVTPVPVHPGEAGAARDRIVRNFRNIDPSWRWQGPDIPEFKPPYQTILPGRDGTIWVQRHTPAVEEPNPDWDAERPDAGSQTLWVEPIVFDVFDVEGRYLGPVSAPRGFSVFVPPLLTRERVWALVPHELGYHQVARLRLVPQAELEEGGGA